MSSSTFKVSLRIWHPSLPPDTISQTLGMKPWVKQAAGEGRETPRGTSLDGTNEKTYWSHVFDPASMEATDGTLESFLTAVSDRLCPHRDFLSHLSEDGGKAELFIGLFIDRNTHIEWTPDLLEPLVSSGVGVSLDIYPPDP